MHGQQGRTWFLGQAKASAGSPRGFAVEFGTGRMVPLTPNPRPQTQARPVRKGG